MVFKSKNIVRIFIYQNPIEVLFCFGKLAEYDKLLIIF